MENYNGIAISKNDKEFVVAFDNFVNGKMQSATNTGKALATIHRYLKNQRDGSFGLLFVLLYDFRRITTIAP